MSGPGHDGSRETEVRQVWFRWTARVCRKVQPSSPSRRAVVKAVQARGVTSRAPPAGRLESRTATAGPVKATSTQFGWSVLWLLGHAEQVL